MLVWPGEGNDLLCAARDPLLPTLREAMQHAYPGRKALVLKPAQDLERMLDGLRSLRVRMIFLAAAMSSNCARWPKKRRWWSWSAH